MNPIEAIEDWETRADAQRRYRDWNRLYLMRRRPHPWPMWLKRNDNLPLGCLAPHLHKILAGEQHESNLQAATAGCNVPNRQPFAVESKPHP